MRVGGGRRPIYTTRPLVVLVVYSHSSGGRCREYPRRPFILCGLLSGQLEARSLGSRPICIGPTYAGETDIQAKWGS